MTDTSDQNLEVTKPSIQRRLFSCFAKVCFRMGSLIVVFLVLVVLLGIYLSYAGFPASVTERVKDEVAHRGLRLDFERLYLNIRRGLVAEDVEIFDQAGGGQIMICNKVHVNLSWTKGLLNGDWLEGLGILDGTIYPGALSILPANLERPWLAMSNLTTFITIETNAFFMKPFQAQLHGLPLQGQGVLMRKPFPDKAGAEPPGDARAADRKAVQSVLDGIWPVLEGLEWSGDSSMVFDFHIDPGNHLEDRVTIEASGTKARIRGQWFSDWHAGLRLDGRILTLEKISAGHNLKRAHVKGAFDIEKRIIDLHAYSALEPACVLSLLPWHWAEAIQGQLQIRGGGFETECWVGPAPFQKAASSISGWTKIQNSSYRDVWIEEGFAAWKREGSDLIFERLKFLCGKGRSQGEVDGDFRIDTTTKEWDCQLTSTVDPHILIPITPTNLVKLTRKFEFNETNPQILLRLSARGQPKPQVTFSGSLEGKGFSYQGVEGLSTESGIAYSNKILRLDPFYVERDEGEIYGWLEVNGPEKTSAFDLKSSVHPQALGQIVSTNVGHLVRYLGVEGIGLWTAQGRADFGAKTNSNFTVQTRMRDASLWRFNSQDLDLSFSSVTTNLQFVIRESELYGGSLTGKIDIAQTQESRNYQAQFSLTDVGFDQVLALIRKVEDPPIEGKLNGQAQFSGSLKPWQLPGTTGTGTIEISEGTLFRLPLFGGLSKLLSKIFPGLGFAVQRDLTASFKLRDEKLYSEDINISGTVASIQMDGHYHFGNELNFDVKAQPLGRGLVADVVQLITLPITTLLEFNLQGTLDQPVWKAKHWPKELSLSLDKENKADE